MEVQYIYDYLKSKFNNAVIELTQNPPSDPYITLKPEEIFNVCYELRDNPELDFDYLMCLSGMDYSDTLGVVYHLYSLQKKHKLTLKTFVLKENPILPSVERIWRSADWHEREAFDLFGIKFEGHHNLTRILLPYDWEGYPLRKDYKEPEFYHGIRVPY